MTPTKDIVIFFTTMTSDESEVEEQSKTYNAHQWMAKYIHRLWQPYVHNEIILTQSMPTITIQHDDVIKWKHFPRNWPFVRGIHQSRWIPHTKASDAELWCFLWSASE